MFEERAFDEEPVAAEKQKTDDRENLVGGEIGLAASRKSILELPYRLFAPFDWL
jgi:hypothetical protein